MVRLHGERDVMAEAAKDELAILQATLDATERGRLHLLGEFTELRLSAKQLAEQFNHLRGIAAPLERDLHRTRNFVRREKIDRIRWELRCRERETRLSYIFGEHLFANRKGLAKLKIFAAPLTAYREYKRRRPKYRSQRKKLKRQLARLLDHPATTQEAVLRKMFPRVLKTSPLLRWPRPDFSDLALVHTRFVEQHREALSIPPPRRSGAAGNGSGVVCYGLHNSLPYSSGGYATRAQGLLNGMAKLGVKGIGLTRPGFPLEANPNLDPASIEHADSMDGIEYRRILEPRRKGKPIESYIALGAEAVRQVMEPIQPRAIIGASNYVTGLLFLAAARTMGVPFIYEVRGFWEITKLSRYPNIATHESYAINRMMEAEMCKRADRVATLTAAMRDELVSRGVPASKIDLVPNCTSLEAFSPIPRDEALAAEFGIGRNSVVIGYVGTFVDYEGLQNLVQACAQLATEDLDFHVLLVGNENTSGEEKGEITSAIEEIVAGSSLGSRIIMPGRVPHEDVARYYSLIDIAPFPRRAWPVCEMVSPMKPMEAMAMEKAVLVSSVGALAEMVSDGETGLIFEKENMDDLAAKLRRLIADPALRRHLGEQSRRWVEQNRQWKHSAAKLIACIEKAEETHAMYTA